jgi:hypothetical protein
MTLKTFEDLETSYAWRFCVENVGSFYHNLEELLSYINIHLSKFGIATNLILK